MFLLHVLRDLQPAECLDLPLGEPYQTELVPQNT